MIESARASPAAQLADSRFWYGWQAGRALAKGCCTSESGEIWRQDFEKLSNVGKPV
jgi:hypothetical protein